MGEKPTSADRAVSRKVVNEMRELRDSKLPQPAADWDIIWPLTGYESSMDPNEKRAGKINEHRQRLEVAVTLAREVTAIRLKKKPVEITEQEIMHSGPTIYFNGTAAHNKNLHEIIANGDFLREFGGPAKIKVTEREDIQHTGHQFEDFPKDLAENGRKIVVISDIYHLPRVRRYPFPKEKVILYPSQQAEVGVGNALREARKIPKYQKTGILPPEDSE